MAVDCGSMTDMPIAGALAYSALSPTFDCGTGKFLYFHFQTIFTNIITEHGGASCGAAIRAILVGSWTITILCMSIPLLFPEVNVTPAYLIHRHHVHHLVYHFRRPRRKDGFCSLAQSLLCIRLASRWRWWWPTTTTTRSHHHTRFSQ